MPFDDSTGYAKFTDLRTLLGQFTVQTGGANPLPAASTVTGKLAYVSDWEGGPGYFLSDGVFWRQPKAGAKFRSVSASTAGGLVTLDPVKDTNCVLITGLINTAFKVAVNPIAGLGLPDGYTLQVHRDTAMSTVLGAIGSLGIQNSGTPGTSLAITDTTAILQWDVALQLFKQVG